MASGSMLGGKTAIFSGLSNNNVVGVNGGWQGFCGDGKRCESENRQYTASQNTIGMYANMGLSNEECSGGKTECPSTKLDLLSISKDGGCQ